MPRPRCNPTPPSLPLMSEPDHYSAEAVQNTIPGNPLYVSSPGHVDLAVANSAAMTRVIGVAVSESLVGEQCEYLTEGKVERPDWTAITGTEFLSPGLPYFLDPVLPGRITSEAPMSPGQYVVCIGHATNTTALDLEIEQPILL